GRQLVLCLKPRQIALDGGELVAPCRDLVRHGAHASSTIFPAWRRDNSACIAAPASPSGNVLAISGFRRPASHQRNSSARLRLTRTGSRAAWAPQTTPMTEMFLTRIRLAGADWMRPAAKA